MNARNKVKKPSYQSLGARIVLLAARLGAWVDLIVAEWLERCAGNAESAQWLFTIGRPPARDFRVGVSLVVPSPQWDQSTST